MVYTAVSELPLFDNYHTKNVDKEKLINELGIYFVLPILEEENCNDSKIDPIIHPTPDKLNLSPVKNKTRSNCKC